VIVLDLSNPVRPVQVARNSAFAADTVAMGGEIVLVGGGASGLHLLAQYTPSLRLDIRLDQEGIHLMIAGPDSGVVQIQRAVVPTGVWQTWKSVTLTNGHGHVAESVSNEIGEGYFRALMAPPAR
jgi:hypothetical protein